MVLTNGIFLSVMSYLILLKYSETKQKKQKSLLQKLNISTFAGGTVFSLFNYIETVTRIPLGAANLLP